MSDIGKDTFKQFYDLFKHITTIDTGAIVILATFFSKSFTNTSANFLVVICVITILISLLFCIVGMLAGTIGMSMVNNQNFGSEQVTKNAGITFVIFFISFASFVIGIMSLGAFVIVNILV